MKKLLPIGLSDFKHLIEDDHYYVDKTLLIDELETSNAKVILLPRPRQFGKTLNLSMLRYFYELSDVSNAYLFKNTAIWRMQEYHALQGTFPVIYLSFRNCRGDTWKHTYEHFSMTISQEFRRHASYLLPMLSGAELKLYNTISNKEASQSMLENSLCFLFQILSQYHKTKVIILIDEHDVPIRAAAEHDFLGPASIFLREFYSAGLNNNASLERAVLIGVTCAGKDKIFSGFNDLSMFSMLETRFSDKFGFTESEIDQLVRDCKIKVKSEAIKDWYRGYRSGDTVVCNPWSILECVDHKGILLTFWGATRDCLFLKKLVEFANNEVHHDLKVLLQGGTVIKQIRPDVLYASMKMNQSAVWNLLFFAGYLTFTKQECMGKYYECTLALPNNEIKSIYFRLIDSLLGSSLSKYFIAAMQTGDSDTMTEVLAEYIRSNFSMFGVSTTKPKKNYHLFMLGLFDALHDTYEVKSNKESGYGRYDIMLIPYDAKKAGIIMEFKKVSLDFKETLASAAKKALAQIHEKKYATELSNRKIKSIIAYGIAFQGKKVLVLKEQIK